MSSPAIDALDAVLDRVRTWPQSRQEDAKRVLLAIEAEGDRIYQLSDDEAADVDAALEEIQRGEVARDEDVVGTFKRYR